MAQFVECLRGMGDACRALEFPIVSGNVSLYNESKATGGGSAILPTPAIGGVGLLDDWETSASIGLRGNLDYIVVIGGGEPELGQSLWLEVCHGRREGQVPATDLALERKAGECIRELIRLGLVGAVHDCSDGGLAVAVAEMALAGGFGAVIESGFTPVSWEAQRFFFAEHQGRYVCTIAGQDTLERVRTLVEQRGLSFVNVGATIDSKQLEFGGPRPGDSAWFGSVTLADLRAAHEGFLPKLMTGELAPAA
jgi:phosphoribosylformylglycinamidine synthase